MIVPGKRQGIFFAGAFFLQKFLAFLHQRIVIRGKQPAQGFKWVDLSFVHIVVVVGQLFGKELWSTDLVEQAPAGEEGGGGVRRVMDCGLWELDERSIIIMELHVQVLACFYMVGSGHKHSST